MTKKILLLLITILTGASAFSGEELTYNVLCGGAREGEDPCHYIKKLTIWSSYSGEIYPYNEILSEVLKSWSKKNIKLIKNKDIFSSVPTLIK